MRQERTAPARRRPGLMRQERTAPVNLTSTHWGTYEVEVADRRVVALRPFDRDPDPSPIGASLVDAVEAECRIAQPMVRAGYLDRGPAAGGVGRGAEPFVAVPWDEALDLVAAELGAGPRRARQRGDLRRLVRLGERRPVPPRAEPAAPVPELHRRLHVCPQNYYASARREVILPHVVGDIDEVLGARRHVEDDPRAHRAGRRVRRHEREERVGEPRRRQPATPARGLRAGRAGRRGRFVELFSPLRDDRRPSVAADVAPDRARHRHRGDARRSRTRSSPKGSTTTAFLDALLRRLSTGSDRVPARRGRRRAEGPPSGRRRSPGSRPTTIRDLARRMAARPHAGHRELVAPAHATTASSRSGWRSRSRRCSARSGSPAAASATATASMPTAVGHRGAARRCRRSARAQPGRRRSSRSRGSPTAARHPGGTLDYDGRAPHASPTSASSTGPAATRSTTTRT